MSLLGPKGRHLLNQLDCLIWYLLEKRWCIAYGGKVATLAIFQSYHEGVDVEIVCKQTKNDTLSGYEVNGTVLHV